MALHRDVFIDALKQTYKSYIYAGEELEALDALLEEHCTKEEIDEMRQMLRKPESMLRFTFFETFISFILNRLPNGQKTKPRIFKPPGAQWMRIARFFFSLESVTEIFEPLYKDFWYEYEKEFVVGHKWKACWIRVRYYWAFVKATGLVKFFQWIVDRVEAIINKIA